MSEVLYKFREATLEEITPRLVTGLEPIPTECFACKRSTLLGGVRLTHIIDAPEDEEFHGKLICASCWHRGNEGL